MAVSGSVARIVGTTTLTSAPNTATFSKTFSHRLGRWRNYIDEIFGFHPFCDRHLRRRYPSRKLFARRAQRAGAVAIYAERRRIAGP